MKAAGADRPRLVETGQVQDVWVDGIVRIEPLGGGTYRIVLFRKHECPDGVPEREIVVSLLANVPALSDAREFLTDLLAGAAVTARVLM